MEHVHSREEDAVVCTPGLSHSLVCSARSLAHKTKAQGAVDGHMWRCVAEVELESHFGCHDMDVEALQTKARQVSRHKRDSSLACLPA